MKNFILNIILFFVFSVLFYMTVLFVWGLYLPTILKPNLNYKIGSTGHLFTRLAEAKKVSDVDVLFLGSSHAYRNFDTRIYSEIGLTSFNLGSSGQTHIQTNVLMRRYLERMNPKLVIYEVYPETFNLDGVESSLDVIANDKNDSRSVNMALQINNIKTYNTLLYGIMLDFLNINNGFKEPIEKGVDKYIPGGFVERRINYFTPVVFNDKDIKFNKEQTEAFTDNLSFLKSKKIKVILVYAPIPPSNYESYSSNKYYDNIMANFAKYYNFNELMELNDSLYFMDSDHLNQKGVELFNLKLIEVLNL